ncbi:winged helix-turn-helix transcriptional regulator [Frankia sp. CNm7]|uniref:Winged helix-turn-helix transcriptional regulator n=1 Tax=Frankia nepalensis TaxID=1836974 RepID=A0A937RIJ1_9ACTN|nr:DUF5937 family protein [Frankia nepalensis]MBL7501432.1 winged helix-turn-helix transcriptional regulator [Frankia nepalensis]MBL7510005.1 winged helix-turn-helix transcriptional regulator [Frankia nepalensis]MBL7517145.1 winged helix-turn-helix transcriptional regulator [Frankia nepalensis]MBL7627984.1 winged helix-turn-helix transcriptional regulator [Frankia nepalensis]
MSVVIVLDGVGPDRFTVAVSPLAELAASLHVLTEHAHHAGHAGWAAAVVRTAPPEFRAGLRRFAPLWTALRWRGFYPGLPGAGSAGQGLAGPAPGAGLAGLSLDRFAELTAYTCASGYRGFEFGRVLRDAGQAAVLRQTAAALPEPHLALAEDLLRDPELLRVEVLGFLDLSRRVFFRALWAETEPALRRAAHRVRRLLADEGPAAALVSLSPVSARLASRAGPREGGPARVVFDKVHHTVINPGRAPVLLIPTRFGAPHLLVKDEPGLPPVVHFPVEAPGVGVTLARGRLLALTDPSRVRLCRLIARQPMTTADLAERLGMTRPQVSRHLRVLRDLGLARVERDGRYARYGLDLAAVERIGHDLATALQY